MSLHVDLVFDGLQQIQSTGIIVGRTVRRVSDVNFLCCSTFTFSCLQNSNELIQLFIPEFWQYGDATLQWLKCVHGLNELFHKEKNPEKIFYWLEISLSEISCDLKNLVCSITTGKSDVYFSKGKDIWLAWIVVVWGSNIIWWKKFYKMSVAFLKSFNILSFLCHF